MTPLPRPRRAGREHRRPAPLPGRTGGLVRRLEGVDDACSSSAGSDRPRSTRPARYAWSTAAKSWPAAAREPQTIFGSDRAGHRALGLPDRHRSPPSPRCGWSPGCCWRLGRCSSPSCCSRRRGACSRAGSAALGAAMLGAVAVTLLLGVELALLEPWLSELIVRARRPCRSAARRPNCWSCPGLRLALLAGLGMAARLAMAFRMPPRGDGAGGHPALRSE
jgi:type IV secretion system protein VirB6